jgi:uncharacterized Zn-binding protein involved in type VI secretion
VGDPTEHGDLLRGGEGSSDVTIESQRAWRAHDDVHQCTDHGAEKCYLGSRTVVINNRMAVRKGDYITDEAPPNKVSGGASQVVIGDIPFGLFDPERLKEFCKDFCDIIARWKDLLPEERLQEMENALNKQLTKSGVPPVKLGTRDVTLSRGFFDQRTWQAIISGPVVNENELYTLGTNSQSGGLSRVLLHEGRHAEQYFTLLRQRVPASGQTPEQYSRATSIDLSVVQAAAGAPLTPGTLDAVFAHAMDEAYFGRPEHRGRIIQGMKANPNNKALEPEYQALAEEQDAFNADSYACDCNPWPEPEQKGKGRQRRRGQDGP